jgi:hypothetical protein
MALLTGGLIAGCVSDQPTTRIPPEWTAAPPPLPRRSPPVAVDRTPRPVPSQPRRPSDPWYPRGGRLSPRWTTVVIHHSATAAGGAGTFDKFHRAKGWDELGYHFVIGNGTDTPDGAVEVGSRWQSQKHGAHCKTPDNYYNEHGIGICLVGDFTKTRPTPRQLNALYRLVRFLTDACAIPPDRVTEHGAIKRGTQCPGPNFALAPLRRYLASPQTASRNP